MLDVRDSDPTYLAFKWLIVGDEKEDTRRGWVCGDDEGLGKTCVDLSQPEQRR